MQKKMRKNQQNPFVVLRIKRFSFLIRVITFMICDWNRKKKKNKKSLLCGGLKSAVFLLSNFLIFLQQLLSTFCNPIKISSLTFHSTDANDDDEKLRVFQFSFSICNCCIHLYNVWPFCYPLFWLFCLFYHHLSLFFEFSGTSENYLLFHYYCCYCWSGNYRKEWLYFLFYLFVLSYIYLPCCCCCCLKISKNCINYFKKEKLTDMEKWERAISNEMENFLYEIWDQFKNFPYLLIIITNPLFKWIFYISIKS